MSTVSVIVPTYNRSALLAEALESICAQDYPATEIIVIDDGSTDDTAEVAQHFANQAPVPVTFLQLEHQWIVRARNAGIRAATGEYIAFLDSDDKLIPGSLARRAQFLDTHPGTALVCGDALLIDERSVEVGLKSAVSGRPRHPGNFRWDTVDYCATTSTVMVRREALLRVGLFDERIVRSAEDWQLWVRFARLYNLAYLEQPLAAYRVHPGNDSSATSEINVGNRLAAALVVDSPEFGGYPAHFRARLLFYRFATAWHAEPKAVALRYFVRAAATHPGQWAFGWRVLRRGLANWRAHRQPSRQR